MQGEGDHRGISGGDLEGAVDAEGGFEDRHQKRRIFPGKPLQNLRCAPHLGRRLDLWQQNSVRVVGGNRGQILLTDGAGNVSMTGVPPREEALLIASYFAEKKIHSVVINTEHEALDRGLAQELADVLKAPCYTLSDIKADNLYATVRNELKG